jgi:DNA-binding response OmpR family regulator
MRILLLEDDQRTARAITAGLSANGYDVVQAGSVQDALARLADHPVDAAVLDLMIPGGSGYDVLRAIRGKSAIPVLILTAREEISDRVEGLECGADDYLTKPFAFAELLARLRALFRRSLLQGTRIELANLELDILHRVASFDHRPIDLTQIEFDLLRCLAERRGEILNRRLLLELVWGYRFDPGTNVVDVHVNRLRRKLEDVGAGAIIRTVRGVGYVVE